MIIPDLCTALMGLIDAQYAAGRHCDASGAIDPDWLYACMAMAGIGHSKRDRYAQLAAAALSSLPNSDRTAFVDGYELPPAVTRLMLAGDVAWPTEPTPAVPLSVDGGPRSPS